MFQFIKKFLKCLFVWHVPAGDTWEADSIIVHAAGSRPDGDDQGPINKYLASLVKEIHQRGQKLPVVPQGEVALSLKGEVARKYLFGDIPLQQSRRENGLGYLDSIDVLHMQKNVCRERGWKKPILITTRPHMLRALLAAQSIGIDAIPYEIPLTIWDPQNEQVWMRGPWLNLPRELIVRIVWLFQGKLDRLNLLTFLLSPIRAVLRFFANFLDLFGYG